MRRRDVLGGGAAFGASGLFGLNAPAQAQGNYPSRPIRFIVPTAAGGAYDNVGRLLADRIGPSLGTMIVENRAGGNATIGVLAVAKSLPDGYTVLLGSNSTHIFQPTMMRSAPYDPVKDFVPIATLAASWTCFAVKSIARHHYAEGTGRLRQGQSGQTDTRDPRHWRRVPYGRRTVQAAYRQARHY